MKSKWLAVSSTRTTIHVFTVTQKHDQKIKLQDEEETKIAGEVDEEEGDAEQRKNKKSTFQFLGGLANYFDSEWSFAKFKVPNEDNSLFQTTCGFNLEGTHLIVITSAGNYYLA